MRIVSVDSVFGRWRQLTHLRVVAEIIGVAVAPHLDVGDHMGAVWRHHALRRRDTLGRSIQTKSIHLRDIVLVLIVSILASVTSGGSDCSGAIC